MTQISLLAHQPLAHALGWTLLHFCWQGIVVAIVLASVLGLLRGGSPQSRYAAACGALLLMVILPLATFARLAAAAQPARMVATDLAVGYRIPTNQDANFQNQPSWMDQLKEKLDLSMPWILCAWCAGVILLLLRLNLGLMAARRLRSAATQPAPEELHVMLHRLCRRLEIKRTVKLLSSALAQVPAVIGWLRPVILIPVGSLVGLSGSQVEALLAHELAHIRRHDYLVSVLQSVVETLLFYHPAVWWVSQQARREREHCCDDLAVQIGGDSFAYAKALSILEERRSSLPTVVLGANGGVLTMRIKRLLGCSESPAASRLAVTLLLSFIMLAVGLGFSARARAAGQQENTGDAVNLPVKYRQWLREDVVWIITPEERKAFLQLGADEERDEFMHQFWERRNPTPGSADNKAKDEHYRRIKYANQHFGTANDPGWRTDRGRVWIVYGPPDEIESHPDSSATGLTKPTEFWRYHLIREHGVERKNVDMNFVDASGHGDYRLVLSPVNPANN